MEKWAKWKLILLLQIMVLVYSLLSVVSKVASKIWVKDGIFSIRFILVLGLSIMVLGVYAFFWQRILKKMDLSVAYVNKAMTLFWTLIWSVLFFSEVITLNNIIGVFLISSGIYMVNRSE